MPKKKLTGSSIVGCKIEKRLTSVEYMADGILSYDLDNVYPQRILEVIRRSGTATACVNMLADFMTGDGFTDPNFSTTKINRRGLTPIKLLRLLSKDYGRYKGFSLHVNYNALFEIDSVNFVPFEFCRKMVEDSNGFSGKIALYDNWDGSKYFRHGRRDRNIDIIDVYNPDPKAIFKQIKASETNEAGEPIGSLETYKGQILYFSAEYESYPLSIIDPVREDAQADHEAKLFKKNNTATNFLASHIVETDKFESNKQKTEFLDNLEQFQGGRKASKMLHIENESMDDETPIVRFTKVDQQVNDKIFEYTETSSQKNIRTAYNIPPVLIGQLVQGKLGTAQEIKDAYAFYNEQTLDERNLMEEIFEEIFSLYKDNINPSGDYSIIPLEFNPEGEGDSTTLIEKIGVGGAQALEKLLANVDLTPNQKKKAITLLFGISEEDAEELTKIEETLTEEEVN